MPVLLPSRLNRRRTTIGVLLALTVACSVHLNPLALTLSSSSAHLSRHLLSSQEPPPTTSTQPTSHHDLTQRLTNETKALLKKTLHSLDAEPGGHEEPIPFASPEWFVYAGISFGLVCTAGMMAGLTMGLLSVDPIELEIFLHGGGAPEQKAQAERIWPVVSQHHRLLVTLLLMNAIANEALPIFLDKLVPPFAAILMSVTLVLIFGEILPSAVFTGSRQLALGAALTPMVQLLMFVTAPISWPLSKLLDAVLGDDHIETRFNRNQLRTFVRLHQNSKRQEHPQHALSHKHSMVSHAHGSEGLSYDEVTIISGALSMMSKTVKDSMTPIGDVKMLEQCRALDHDTMADLVYYGHSRIPVYQANRNNIIGILIMKRLIILDPDEARPISTLPLRKPLVVHPSFSLFAMLNEFQIGRSHLALVTEQTEALQRCWDSGEDITAAGVVIQGLITCEDVIEELIQEEIEDEDDLRDDLLAGKLSPIPSQTDMQSVVPHAEQPPAEGQSQSTNDVSTRVRLNMEGVARTGMLVRSAVAKFQQGVERSRRRKANSRLGLASQQSLSRSLSRTLSRSLSSNSDRGNNQSNDMAGQPLLRDN